MSGLIKSSLILSFARVTNYALLLVSPILLVRILDPVSFGQYREFIAYAMLITSLGAFNIKSNILYFVPRDRDNTRTYISHTTLMALAGSVIVCFLLWLFRDLIVANTDLNFLLPLIVYVALFLNVDFITDYWLAEKQPKYVMYFTLVRTAVRLSGVIGVAIVTQDVLTMIYALCAVEALRVLIVLVLMRRIGILSWKWNPPLLREQLVFVLPLAVSGSMHHVHQHIGQIVVSAQLGVVALAIYTVAKYQVPVLNIVRGAIGDSIFPDMVRQAAAAEGDRLALWKRANVAYTFLITPFFVLAAWYADRLIPWVFTEEYADAVPLFRILAFVMIVQCFEVSSPLRAIGRTKLFIAGNLLMLITNLAFILAFLRYPPETAIFGPALGVVAGYIVQHVFLAWCISQVYGMPIPVLLKWPSIAKIGLSALLGCAVLLVGETLPIPEALRVPVFASLFAGSYYLGLRHAGIEEVERVVGALARRFKR